MSNLKISQLTAGTAQNADLIPIARSGQNFAVPASTIGSLVALPTFQTNSSNNAVQSLLNLVAGSNITLGSDSAGNVTVTSTPVTFGTSATSCGFWGPGLAETSESIAAYNTGFNSVSTVVGTVYVCQFNLQCSWTIRKVSASCGNNLSGSTANATFGIYSLAGNLLVDGGLFNTLTSPAVQTNTLASPVNLSPGTYWLAQATNVLSADTFLCLEGNNGVRTAFNKIWNSNTTRMGSAANGLSSLRLPATLGAITPVDFEVLGIFQQLPFFEV